MILAKPAWAAFKNMLRAAIRNPLWAFLSLIAAPFRVWKPLLQSFFILFVILFVAAWAGAWSFATSAASAPAPFRSSPGTA
ncbi:MAG: hypothetical protein ACRCSX_03505 [Allorhizobium sp.]|jgi:type IV secretion system protein VirD4